jgi:hypothetical protein
MRERLIRFVVCELDEMSGVRQGFFEEAYKLRCRNVLPEEEQEALQGLLKWFGKHLIVPPRFNRTSSKGWWRRDPRGISWFRVSAIEHISKAQQIAQIMRRNGTEVQELRTARPGFEVFADEYQVVAEPFMDIGGLK